ncbi:hypothetical protein KFK09_003763 [Dendrobium nobile]|uniref:Secreted protein n=1 Tax=Dendrobium nobile TaxID=94219 RepID=A0A8T3C3F9_DENNO|nr:hypothetical protein KFK09_003763 [Dendrobium nobile]
MCLVSIFFLSLNSLIIFLNFSSNCPILSAINNNIVKESLLNTKPLIFSHMTHQLKDDDIAFFVVHEEYSLIFTSAQSIA